MHDARNEAPVKAPSPIRERAATPAPDPAPAKSHHRRERHAWRLVLGLTGLLGAVWLLAIVSRYPNILTG